MKMLAVIRVRSSGNISPDHKKALELLRLHKVNHLVLVVDSDLVKKFLILIFSL